MKTTANFVNHNTIENTHNKRASSYHRFLSKDTPVAPYKSPFCLPYTLLLLHIRDLPVTPYHILSFCSILETLLTLHTIYHPVAPYQIPSCRPIPDTHLSLTPDTLLSLHTSYPPVASYQKPSCRTIPYIFLPLHTRYLPVALYHIPFYHS